MAPHAAGAAPRPAAARASALRLSIAALLSAAPLAGAGYVAEAHPSLIRSQRLAQRAVASVGADGDVRLGGAAVVEQEAQSAGVAGAHRASSGTQVEEETWVEYLMMPNDDLVLVDKGPATESRKTEVQLTSLKSNYQEIFLKNTTPLELTDNRWRFLPTPDGDIMALLTGPITASGMTELYLLPKESNFSTIAAQITTGLGIASPQEWTFSMDSIGDLWCFKRPDANYEWAEVHLLTKGSNYQRFTYHTHVGLEPTVAADAVILATPERDLLAVQTEATPKGTALVHVLSRQSGYKNRSLLADTGIITQGPMDQFTIKRNGDLVYIMRPHTQGASKYTYVAVVSQQSNYERIVSEATTAFTL